MESRINELSAATNNLSAFTSFKKKSTELDRLQNELKACTEKLVELRTSMTDNNIAILELSDEDYQTYMDDVVSLVDDLHAKNTIEEQVQVYNTIKTKLHCMEQYLANRKQKIIYV